MSKELDEELNDPGNEDPGSLMDDAEVPLTAPAANVPRSPPATDD